MPLALGHAPDSLPAEVKGRSHTNFAQPSSALLALLSTWHKKQYNFQKAGWAPTSGGAWQTGSGRKAAPPLDSSSVPTSDAATSEERAKNSSGERVRKAPNHSQRDGRASRACRDGAHSRRQNSRLFASQPRSAHTCRPRERTQTPVLTPNLASCPPDPGPQELARHTPAWKFFREAAGARPRCRT